MPTEKKPKATKRVLAQMVCNSLGISREAGVMVIDTVVEKFIEGLEEFGEVRISGFGKFEVRQHKGRAGRNPKTGESIWIPPKARVAFVPSQSLKNKIEESCTSPSADQST